jgi:hypothetical protein
MTFSPPSEFQVILIGMKTPSLLDVWLELRLYRNEGISAGEPGRATSFVHPAVTMPHTSMRVAVDRGTGSSSLHYRWSGLFCS